MKSTTNYGMFKLMGGNRSVTHKHVNKLIREIEKKNLLAEFPILVNEKREVVDGQHRLMAASRLSTPIYYQEVKGLKLEDVMNINTAQKSWTISNFVNSFIDLGYDHYITLKEFKETYDLSWLLAAQLLGGIGVPGGTMTHRIKRGDFKIDDFEKAELVAKVLQNLSRYADFKTTTDNKLAQTIILLLGQDDFNVERLLAKYRNFNLNLRKQHNVKHYLVELDDAYNFNAKVKVPLYYGQV